MEPAPYNLIIWVNSTWRKHMQYLTGELGSPAVDLTGYAAQFHIYVSKVAVFSMSNLDGGITLGTNGFIDLLIPSATTATFPSWNVLPGQVPSYVLYLQPPVGDEDPLITGTVTLTGTFQ
jgi:hypothetical protein